MKAYAHVIMGALALTGLTITSTQVRASPTVVKFAFIDPLSGGGGSTGEIALKSFQLAVETQNTAHPEIKLEMSIFDNKLSPQETLIQVQKAIDSGIRIIVQGSGSSVAHAISDFLRKYNERNPDKPVLYLNYAAVDPALTGAKCNFWHFRFDSHAEIKMAALVGFLKTRKDVQKVYLMNQDYSFGQAVRAAARKNLKEKRPDILVVGDDLTPLQKINDFSPYIAKIRASGADSVVTSNWGQDLSLLLKAAGDAGLGVKFFTYHSGTNGTPTVMKQANLKDQVYQVSEGFPNVPSDAAKKLQRDFRARTGSDLTFARVFNTVHYLVKAVGKANSADPRQIAQALEGMHAETIQGQDSFIRAEDHQIFQPLYISRFGPVDSATMLDSENTGWGWSGLGQVSVEDSLVPNACTMDRPS